MVWSSASKAESGWSFIYDPVPWASHDFENGHVILFVPKMLQERFAEAFWLSSFLHLVGKVFPLNFVLVEA